MKKFFDIKYFVPTIFIIGLILWIIQFLYDFLASEPLYVFSNGVFHQDHFDNFADFFNINLYIKDFSPYLNGNDSSYPPFNFVIAIPFLLIMKLGGRENLTPLPIGDNSVWQDWLSLGSLFLTYLLMITILVFLIRRRYNLSMAKSIFIFTVSLLSSPMLFLIERANYVFFVFFFVAIFLLCYENPKPSIRAISIITLSIAAAMKIYPAIFSLLWLRKKRYKEFTITALLSISLFFLPFFMLKGGFLLNVEGFLFNLQSFSSYERLSIDISTGNFFRILAYVFGKNYLSETLSNFTLVFRFILFTLSCISIFITKVRWQQITLLSLAITIVPMPSMIHSLIFIILGFVPWICRAEHRKIDYFYAVLFLLLICPFQYGYIIEPYPYEAQFLGIQWIDPHYIGLSNSTFVQGLCVILLTLTICIDIIIKHLKNNSKSNICTSANPII